MGYGNKLNKASRRWFSTAVSMSGGLFEAIGSPVALDQASRLRNRDYLGLVSCSVDPRDYQDASSFADDYLAAEAFSKFPSWDLGLDRESLALKKFEDSELQCLETNRRLRTSCMTPLKEGLMPASVLFTARRKISYLLGDFSWQKAERFFGFGPGASFKSGRRHRDAFYKFSGIPETTRECAVAADAAICSVRGWEFHLRTLLSSDNSNDSLVDVVEGNRVTTVPKNAKIDRVIAIEPLMNMYLQKGIGSLIRRALRKVGIDLNDQEPNQRLALEGSLSNSWATIDLSSASDSVASELVHQLLPPDWFSAMELCRSKRGILPSGKVIHYQKFSSMGNGFTFELESLIFWALCSAVELLTGRVGSGFLVYGDDIVVPSDMAPSVIDVLAFAGFSCNSKKTFVDGPFRESCGKHYFLGTDVTPFYVREDMNVSQLILFMNNLRRYSRMEYGLDGRFAGLYELGRSFLPVSLRRPKICDGYGDSALFGDFDEVCPPRALHGHEGWDVRVRLPISSGIRADGFPYLLRTLSGMREKACKEHERGFRGFGDQPSLREILDAVIDPIPAKLPGSIPGPEDYRSVTMRIPQWVNYGPWIDTHG